MFKNLILFLLLVSSSFLLAINLSQLSLDDGFNISIFAQNLDAPRQMAEGKNGTIFVGERGGKIVALRDTDNNGVADSKIIIANDLTFSTGLSLYKGDLYFSEISTIWKIENIEDWINMGDDYGIMLKKRAVEDKLELIQKLEKEIERGLS